MSLVLPFNYHHLYYFWMTAKAGRISEAGEKLLLSQPALSLQIQQLERFFRKRLLDRGRRGVTLTAEGRIAFEYCERIFSQGEELAAALSGAQSARPAVLRLGVAGPIPRLAVTQVLRHANALGSNLRVSIRGGSFEDLRDRLERHRLDVVMSNVDFSNELGVEFRSRLVGTLPVHFVAIPRLAAKIRRFPQDLSAWPMLLRAPESPVRKEVDLFLCRHRVAVSVVAEVEDSELVRSLTLEGQGVAAMDSLTAREDLARGRLAKVHRKATGIEERIWLVAGRHPKPNPALNQALRELLERLKLEA